jgi:hypothetical protein
MGYITANMNHYLVNITTEINEKISGTYLDLLLEDNSGTGKTYLSIAEQDNCKDYNKL